MKKTKHVKPEAPAAAPPVDPLAGYEHRARIFVVHEGGNPDEMVRVPHTQGLAVNMSVARWQIIAAQLRRHDLFNSLLYADVAPVVPPGDPPPDGEEIATGSLVIG